ncbi:hypothetical protein MKW92_002990 [Papaver armeniacum]|nr:hypothetical protein MKW92_002990 [Papaver armeniacum]
MTIAYKLAINDEMNLRILIAYRSIFATIFIVPIACFVPRPKLTWTILFQSFLCALFGFSLSQNMYIESKDMTSATFPLFHCGNLMFSHIEHHIKHAIGIKPLGAILSVGSRVSYSIWLIIRPSYPVTTQSHDLDSFMAAIQSIGFALCTVRDWSQWKLGWNGVVASGVMMTLIAWCVKVRGPLFASVFSPLGLVLVALTGSVLLNEKMHLGCVIGGVLIAIGLYFVLWGKAREMKRLARLMPVTNSTDSEAQSEASTSNANDDNNHAMIKNGEDAILHFRPDETN